MTVAAPHEIDAVYREAVGHALAVRASRWPAFDPHEVESEAWIAVAELAQECEPHALRELVRRRLSSRITAAYKRARGLYRSGSALVKREVALPSNADELIADECREPAETLDLRDATEREHDIAQLIARGYALRAAAEILGIARATVHRIVRGMVRLGRTLVRDAWPPSLSARPARRLTVTRGVSTTRSPQGIGRRRLISSERAYRPNAGAPRRSRASSAPRRAAVFPLPRGRPRAHRRT